MKKTIATVIVLATLCVLATAVYASPVIIDHFTQPTIGQNDTVTGVGSQSNTTTGLAGVLGGARTTQISVITSSYGQTSSIRVNAVANGGIGLLSMNNESGQNGVGTVTWDANGAGLGGVDLTSSGTNPYIQATILASDLNLGFRIDITETAAAGGSTATWSTNLGSGVSYVNQALSSFTNAGIVDFTKVNKIVLTMSGPSAEDGTLDLLEVTNTPVPEPVTMSMLALGGLALLVRRRRS